MAFCAGTLLALLCSLGAVGLDRGRDLAQALEALTAPHASDRVRAERWISVHAAPADFPALAEAAQRGDAEVRARLTRALGADGRHLGLALFFAGEREAVLAEVGVEAVRDQLGRWSEGLGEPLAAAQPDDLRLREALVATRESQPGEIYRIALAGAPVEEVVDRLVRLANLSLPVAVDPLLGAAPLAEHGAVLEGTWDEILLGIASRFGATLEGALATDARGRSLPVFVCLRPAQVSRFRSAHEALLEWCRLSLGEGAVATRAARALAESSWPAALFWLEERWLADGDPRALHGLLVAAGRGRVVPALERPEVVRSLLARADAAQEGGDAESLSSARRIARALAALGPLAADGSRLDEILVEGEIGPGRALRLRLVALEGMSSTSDSVARWVAGWLTRPAGAIGVDARRQALRTWSAIHPARRDAVVLGDAEGVLRTVSDREDARELARLLLVGRVDLPVSWRDERTTAGLGAAARSAVFDWLFGRGEDDAAARHLLDACRLDLGSHGALPFLAAREHCGAVLRDWVRRGDGVRVAAWLEDRRAGLPEGEARRALHALAVLAGAEVPARDERDLALALTLTAAGDSAVSGREELFGALAARPSEAVSVPARAALLRRLGSAPDREDAARVLRGVERALADLLAEGGDQAASLFTTETREALEKRSDVRSRDPILARWRAGRPVDLDRLERAID